MFLIGTTLGLLTLELVIICVTMRTCLAILWFFLSLVLLHYQMKTVFMLHMLVLLLNISLALYGVLYIPSFRCNLLSVSKLSSQLNGYIIFTPQHCLMQAPLLRKPQVLGEHYVGLYLLKPSPIANLDDFIKNSLIFSIDTQPSVCNASMSSEDVWHARLGHLPFTKLLKLGLLSNHTNIDLIKECLIYCKARQHRLPFLHS